MYYKSTRDSRTRMSACRAIVKGISNDGGLFVPCRFPNIWGEHGLESLDYKQLAARVMHLYLDEFSYEELYSYADRAYSGFDSKQAAALVALEGGRYMLELWHGPTLAFKDMALCMLPYLLKGSLRVLGEDKKILVLAATSGDTGKAALQGFADVQGTAVHVFYPKEGVSCAQRLQMSVQSGDNVHVCAIHGNFDDAQAGVKALFANAQFHKKILERGYHLSSANSINWGRLLPQIVYYIWVYLELVRLGKIGFGDKIDVCVPTGNFGNILAAYYAKKMGIPIGRLICASNQNKVLDDFLRTGIYDIRREFFSTNSPSMDILISSNLERLLYDLYDEDDSRVCTLMEQLKKNGYYEVDSCVKQKLKEHFSSWHCTQDKTLAVIERVFRQQNYLLDTHTAVAFEAAQNCSFGRPCVICSTASPYKFADSVLQALGIAHSADVFECAELLEKATGLPIPSRLSELKGKGVRFDACCFKEDMSKVILDWIEKYAGR